VTFLLLVGLILWIAVIPLTVVISALIYPYLLRRRMAARAASGGPPEAHSSGRPEGTAALHIGRTRSSVASR
jgi:hypothetical protein